MQTISELGFVIGVYKRELKNRFLCEVQIGNKDIVCYVPSSCHLSNFLQLEGKRVLLVPTTTSRTRTSFALFAVPYKRSYIVLNTSIANRAMEGALHGKRFSFLGKRTVVEKECLIEGYKADLYLPETKTIIEIKSIITVGNSACFPTVYSERAIEQLKKAKILLKEGYNFVYIFVSLNPYVKSVRLSEDVKQAEYKKLFLECVDNGMAYRAYTSKLNGVEPVINREIPLMLEK